MDEQWSMHLTGSLMQLKIFEESSCKYHRKQLLAFSCFGNCEDGFWGAVSYFVVMCVLVVRLKMSVVRLITAEDLIFITFVNLRNSKSKSWTNTIEIALSCNLGFST